jgi:DNA-directed RNA polymerase subunit alpha
MICNSKSIIRPRELLIDYISLSQSYGKFIVEPLENGFGITLGNALRRILLSSLSGYAITSIFIKNVKHEYEQVNGIKEDIQDLILNLKAIQISLTHKKKYINASIIKKGPCVIYARDVQGPNLKIYNKNLYICTISSNININILLTIEMGKGFATENQNKLDMTHDQKVGIIWVNSNFSPIKKISYNILNSKVGKKTNYDKLIMEIWTNNSINPEYALSTAAKILQEQISVFINFPHMVENKLVKKAKKVSVNKNLFRKIVELELSVRASNCLNNAKIYRVIELVQKTEIEMLKTKNFGRKTLKEIKNTLARIGLSLNMNIKDTQ